MKWLPQQIALMKLDSPAYALFLVYPNLSGSPVPFFRIATKEYLIECGANNQGGSIEAWESAWVRVLDSERFECKEIQPECDCIYSLLGRWVFNPILSLPLIPLRFIDEDLPEYVALRPVQKLFCKIARRLNKEVDWARLIPVTEDFVVIATTLSGSELSDYPNSIPKQRMDQLRDKWKPHFDEFGRSSIFTALWESYSEPRPPISPIIPIAFMGIIVLAYILYRVVFTAGRGYFINALWIESAVIVCSATVLSIAVIYHHRYRQAKYEDALLRVLDEAFEEPS